jgi:hypothetical protein
MLGALAVAAGLSMFAAPANAMNTSANCHLVQHGNPPSTDYPTNWLISCPRTYTAGSAEAAAVVQNEQLLWENIQSKPKAPNSIHVRDLLSNAHVTFYFFSYEQDAYDTLGISGTASAGRTAISFVLTGAGNPQQVYPITLLWNHWGTGLPLQNYQLTGKSNNHEIGHHMDRQWAVSKGLTPTATATIVGQDARWLTGIGYDLANLSAAEINTMQTTYPRLLNSSGQVLTNEVFAELFAFKSGGGVVPAEATFLHSAFPCATWIMDQLYLKNGNPPATPYLSPAACYGHSN